MINPTKRAGSTPANAAIRLIFSTSGASMSSRVSLTSPSSITGASLKLANFALAVTALLLATGCASRGVLAGHVDKYHAIYFGSVSAFDQPYVAKVSQGLALYGLPTTGATNQPNSLQCKLEIDQANVWNFRVAISLWDADKEMAAGIAENHGWGSLLSPSGAVGNLFDSALSQLERQLEKGGRRKTTAPQAGL